MALRKFDERYASSAAVVRTSSGKTASGWLESISSRMASTASRPRSSGTKYSSSWKLASKSAG